MTIHEELARLQQAEIKAQYELDVARRNLRAFINNNNLNEKPPTWPTPEEAKRVLPIMQNGNTGEHYD